MRSSSLFAIAVLSACVKGTDSGDSQVVTDTSDSRVTDTALDTDQFTFRSPGAWEGSTLVATHIQISESGATFGASHWGIQATGEDISLEVLPAPEEEREEWPGEGGVTAAWYAVFLFEDADSDGTPGDDEVYLAMAPDYLLYLAGTLDEQDVAAGLSEGWNIVRPPTESGLIEPATETPHPLVDLSPVSELTLGGEVDLPSEPSTYQFAVVPAVLLEGGEATNLLEDGPLVLEKERWSISFSDMPHESHLATDPGGAEIAVEVPLAYQDQGATGFEMGTDQIIAFGCQKMSPVMAMWSAQPTTPEDAMSMQMQGRRPGWSAWAGGPGQEPVPITTEQLQDLTLSEACAQMP